MCEPVDVHLAIGFIKLDCLEIAIANGNAIYSSYTSTTCDSTGDKV